MTASQNVILELKKLGIQLDMPPNKLKSGFGDGVCAVLMALGQISLQNKFKFKKPVHKNEGNANFNDDADEMGDEFEGNADVADMANNNYDKGSENDDIDEDYDFGGLGGGGGDKNKENE